MNIISLLLAATATVSAAPAADNLYARYFGNASGGKVCYARSYDAVHLVAHPKQTVRRIQVDFDQSWRDDPKSRNTAADFQPGITFRLKRSGEWYSDELYCKTAAGEFDCYLDADGGTIRMTPDGDALRLDVTAGGGGTDQIAVEGMKDFGTFGGPRSDDRVFLLQRTDRALCHFENVP